MKVELTKTFRFEAAHQNPKGGAAAARMHGHGYRVDLVVEGAVDPHLGWVVDYGDIAARFALVHEQVDHRCLNEVDGVSDASLDGVRGWLRERLAPEIPHFKDVAVSVAGACVFRPALLPPDRRCGLPQRMEFGFEAAHFLPNLPAAHKCRRMHGHSFRVAISAKKIEHLTGRLRTLYDALDHQCLNEVPGLENATSENLCRWIWDRLSGEAPDLTLVLAAETCSARSAYRGE